MRKMRKPIERLIAARKKLQEFIEAYDADDEGSLDALDDVIDTMSQEGVVKLILDIVSSAEFAAMSSNGTQDRIALKLADEILRTGEPEEE